MATKCTHCSLHATAQCPCGAAAYCGKACQTAHWSTHKDACLVAGGVKRPTDGASGSYWEETGKYQAEYQRLLNFLPREGEAETDELELIRALSNMYKRYYNDGDTPWEYDYYFSTRYHHEFDNEDDWYTYQDELREYEYARENYAYEMYEIVKRLYTKLVDRTGFRIISIFAKRDLNDLVDKVMEYMIENHPEYFERRAPRLAKKRGKMGGN